MFPIIGIVTVFAMVFGVFLMEGGSFEVLAEAAPMEFLMIFGSACGALVIGQEIGVLKGVAGGFGKVMAGPKWKKQDYSDLLALLFQLTKLMKTKGVVALEPHIEKPDESAIFQKYPKILKDHHVTHFICDTLRMMTRWKSSSKSTTMKRWRRRTPCRAWPTVCPRSASSPRCWAS